MMTHSAGGDHECIPVGQYVLADTLSNYRIELSSDLLDEQGNLLDHVISFAFDTLHVRVLDVRVVQAKDCQPLLSCQDVLLGGLWYDGCHARVAVQLP